MRQKPNHCDQLEAEVLSDDNEESEARGRGLSEIIQTEIVRDRTGNVWLTTNINKEVIADTLKSE